MLDETQFLSRPRRALAFQSSRAASVSVSIPAARLTKSAYWPAESHSRSVWRQFQLARPGLDAAQFPAHRVAAKIPSLLRRRFQNRMPDRLREIHDHERGRRRIDAPPRQIIFEGRGRPASRVEISSETGRRIRISRITFCSTNIFTATTAAASARRIRPAGPALIAKLLAAAEGHARSICSNVRKST